MQNGNTTNSSDDTPTYPWSSFFSGHPPTIDELPHRPRLTLETSDLPVQTSGNGNPRLIPARNADDISKFLPREATPPSLPLIRTSGEPIRCNDQDHNTDGPYHLMASFAAQNSIV